MDSPQDFGVATGHACSNAPLEGFKMSQDSRGWQHSQEETQNVKSSADVRDVGLSLLLL